MAIDAVADAQVLRGNRHSNILALVQGALAGYSCHKDCAVDALANVDAVHVGSDVQIGVFATDDANIPARGHVSHVSDCHTLVQKGDVLGLVSVLLLRSEKPARLGRCKVNLLRLRHCSEEPVLESTHVNLGRLLRGTLLSEEGSQLGKGPLIRRAVLAFNFEQDSESIELVCG